MKSIFRLSVLFFLASANSVIYGQKALTNSDPSQPVVASSAADSSPGGLYAPQVTPPSPQAAAFQRYGDYPVTHTTGVPDISIPIYTVNTGKLKLPISISYHASGFKPSEKSGIIGLGWLLNAGGRISRTVIGDPDELAGTPTSLIPASQQVGLTDQPSDANKRLYQSLLVANETSSGQDLEPDIFYYNFPGGSGKFMLKNVTDATGRFTGAKKPITIPYRPLKIRAGSVNFNSSFGYLEIIDEDGTTYRYGKSVDGLLTAIEETYPNRGDAGRSYDTSWLLTDIIAQGGKEKITIKYNTRLLDYSASRTDAGKITSSDWQNSPGNPTVSDFVQTNSSGVTYPKISVLRGITNTTHYVSYISSIEFNNGKVVFAYSTIGASSKLTSIEVLDINNKTVQKHQLVQENFATDAVRYKLSKLMRLGALTGSQCENHQFDYNEPTSAAPNNPSDLGGLDYWRYYNGKNSNGDLLPPNYLIKVFANNGGSTYYQTGTNDREADESATKLYVIRKITYPTGGSSEFEFEGNKVWWAGSARAAGGLRVKRIINNVDSKQEIKSYEYGGEQCAGCGFIRLNPFQIESFYQLGYQNNVVTTTAGGCVTDNRYIINISSDFTDGSSYFETSPVLYTSVSEYKGDANTNGGKTIYTYSLPALTFSNNPTLRYLSSVDFWQGSDLLSESIYKYAANSTYTLINKKTYTYNKVLRETISGQKFQPFAISSDGEPSYSHLVCGHGKNAYEVYDYSISSGMSQVAQKETIVNADVNNGQVTTEEYQYPADFIIPKLVKITDSKGQIVETSYRRSFDDLGSTYVGMVTQNVLNPVIEEIIKVNSVQTKRVKTNYGCASGDWGISNPCIYVPSTIETQLFPNGTPATTYQEVNFNKYNESGYATQFSEINGLTTGLTWFTSGGMANQLASKVIGLTTTLPQITSYQYYPLVGLKNITDINSLSTNYSYDELNRLSTIKDHWGNLLETYHYNHAITGCNNTNTLISPNFKKILIVGNSITQLVAQTGTDGWQSTALLTNTNIDGTKGWGRAASTKATDFAHILESRFQQLNSTAKLLPLWEAPWEYDFANVRVGWPYYNYTTLKNKITNFFGTTGPDLVIIRLGENVNNGTVEPYNFKENFKNLIDQVLSVSSPGAKVIVTNSMWPDQPLANARIKEVATERYYPFVDLSDMYANPVYLGGNDPATLAQFPNDGGDRHPGDVGMLEIADRIWGKLFNESNQLTAIQPGCPGLTASVLSPANNASLVGTASTTQAGRVTTALSITTCTPTGSTISQVEVWASLPDGRFSNRMGYAVADVSRPGVYTLSASEGTANGQWPVAYLDTGTYRFYAVVTAGATSLTTNANLVTLTAPAAAGPVTKASFLPRYACNPPYNTCIERTIGGLFQGSDDNTTWANLGSIPASLVNQTSGYVDVALSASKTYRYLRYVAASGCYGELFELQFWSGSTRIAGTPFGSTSYYNSDPSLAYTSAFDGSTSTLWIGSAPGPQNYAGLDLGGGCPVLTAGVLLPAHNASLVGIASTTQPGTGKVTTALSVTTCAPAGSTISLVEVWAKNSAGLFATRMGYALADLSRPGTYTLSASEGTTNGKWIAYPLDPGGYRFYAVVTTTVASLTTSENVVTLTAPPTAIQVATYVRIYPRDDNSVAVGRMDGSYFQGSNDNVNWLNLAQISSTNRPTFQAWTQYNFTGNTAAYRYLRFLAGPSSYGELAELEFYNSTGKLSGTQFGGGGTYNSTVALDKAFDGNTTTKWIVAAPSSSPINFAGIDVGSNSGSCPNLIASIVTPSTNASVVGTTFAGTSGVTMPFTVTACAPSGQTIGEVAIIASTTDGRVVRKVGNAVAISGSPGSYSLSSLTVANGISGGWLPGTGGNVYTDAPPTGQAGPLNANMAFKYWTQVKTADGSTTVNSATITGTMTAPAANATVTKARIYTRANSALMSRYVNGVFQGSNDNSTWTTLTTITSAPTASTWVDYPITTTQTYRYLRYLPSSSSYGELMELEFYGSSGKLSGTPFGSANTYDYPNTPASTYTYLNAFDGNLSTMWNGAAAGPSTNWAGIDLGL